jgi:hypothetical protein
LEVQEAREEQREQRIRLGSIERGIATLITEITEMGLRLDLVHDRIDRIERRLGLIEA